MKKAGVICILLLGMMAFRTDKKFHFELSEKQVSRMFNDLANIQQLVDRSSLPHDQVKYIINSIDSIKIDLGPQLGKQLDTVQVKK